MRKDNLIPQMILYSDFSLGELSCTWFSQNVEVQHADARGDQITDAAPLPDHHLLNP